MSHSLLQAADLFFLAFHTLWTLFTISGWIFRKTRKIHLIALGLTAFSWFILGIWYGIGFCFCTMWHWDVRRLLGQPIRSRSYIHFLILELTGWNPDPYLVDVVVMSVFVFTVICTFCVNFKDYLKRKKR